VSTNAHPIILLYMPALHAGYWKFLEQYPDSPVWLLGESFLELSRPLQKDVRRMSPGHLQTALEALGRSEVEVVEISSLTDRVLKKPQASYLLPDEDISHQVVESYLTGQKVTFIPVFLRWDSQQSLAEKPVAASEEARLSEADSVIWDELNQLKEKSGDWWRQVAVVIVDAKNCF
jgi:hypothetical protein